MEETNKKSGLATAGLVLGIIGVCFSIIPVLNTLSFIFGILAVVFGIIPIIKKANKGKAIAALVLGILSIVIALVVKTSWISGLNNVAKEINNTSEEIQKDIDNATGDNTDEILEKYADVTLGNFEVSSNGYYDTTKLTVKVLNKASEKKSFSIQVEAVASDGSRIDSDYVYANDLGSGQSQDFDIFQFVSSDKLDLMRTATFKIVDISMY